MDGKRAEVLALGAVMRISTRMSRLGCDIGKKSGKEQRGEHVLRKRNACARQNTA